MAEGLFDGRYRYDFIYPRGRSGETLRAYDTHQGDRPVVIKRPAPSDAPPIRAGQEVSILNERKALLRLAGHPVLSALAGEGQFVVGGMAHHYIVLERATGDIVEDTVLALGAAGERLPELEMLVILEHLLDLLQTAHARDIVYNDVDAKHLFWSREQHRLKVIDWGNAVFLEGDDMTPQGVSRQSDVQQVGALLYFVLTGGARPDVPRDAPSGFRVAFGEDDARVHPRLASIVSKALHPNRQQRYDNISQLRRDLADYRSPLERERNTVLARVNERLRRDRSQEELHGLLATLRPALDADPGYPASLAALREIQDRLGELQLSADLDAARIYIDSGGYDRAAALLEELLPAARGATARLITLLLDVARLLGTHPGAATPATNDALRLLYEGEPARAVNRLLAFPDAADNPDLHLQLAARISSLTDVLALRPHLHTLASALAALEADGVRVGEPRALLEEVHALPPSLPDPLPLAALRDAYRIMVDRLTALDTLLSAVAGRGAARASTTTALEGAKTAAMTLADSIHVIGRQATAHPREALAALDTSRAIDPAQADTWDVVAALLEALYRQLQTYQAYTPLPDGSDLHTWLDSTQAALLPLADRLFDEMLVGMVEGLGIAGAAWDAFARATVQGNRVGALTALAEATDAVGTVAPALAGWLNAQRSALGSAAYVERHALAGGLGRALADGWEAFDKGRLADAERLGQQAVEIARSDAERAAAERLRHLAESARAWAERGLVLDVARTQATLDHLLTLYTPKEVEQQRHFSEQMPTPETYLRAMHKGLVDLFARRSTAAVRLLLAEFVLRAARAAHEDDSAARDFWRAAALNTLPDHAPRHPLVRALDEFVQRRSDLAAAAARLNTLTDPAHIDETRRALAENPQARLLAGPLRALRELDAALRDWADGEYKLAGLKLENALAATAETPDAALPLDGFRAWLSQLQAAAALLHTRKRAIAEEVATLPDAPTPSLAEAHAALHLTTEQLLGPGIAATARGWHDMYSAFAALLDDPNSRRSAKLTQLSTLFRALFIDRHPAYPLYRHWADVTERSPEFPAPPTTEPTPRLAEAAPDELDDLVAPFTRLDDPADDPDVAPARPARRRWLAGLGVLGVVAALAAGVLALWPGARQALLGGGAAPLALTISPTPPAAIDAPLTSDGATPDDGALVALAATDVPLPSGTPTPLPPAVVLPTRTPVLFTRTPGPSRTPPPTRTPPPSQTATPTSSSPTVTLTPTPSVPPDGARGVQALLPLLGRTLREDPARATWDVARVSVGPDAAYWRVGIGEDTSEDVFLFAPTAGLLAHYYGDAAPARLSASEVTVTLATYNPARLSDGRGVSYALVWVPASALATPHTVPSGAVGLEVALLRPGVITVGQRLGNQVSVVGQRSIGDAPVRLRLERTADGQVRVLLNGDAVGGPLPQPTASEPLVPALLLPDGGVILHMSSWLLSFGL